MASVLVIEDNPLNMKLASLHLRSAGHTVLCAVDAEAGLALAHATLPDLILMDCQLPGMSGLAATTLLKADPATARIPVIVLTAVGMSGDRESARKAGCDAFIVKPLNYHELHAAIEMLLAGGAANPTQHAGQNALPSNTLPRLHSGARSGEASDEASSGTVGGMGEADAVPAVEVGILEGLIGTEPALVLEFLQAFQIGAATIAQELRFACANHQSMQAARQAHKLKSSAQAAGALVLGRLCAEMESAGRAGDMAALMMLLPAFEGALAAVNAFLDSLRPPGVVCPPGA